MSLGKESRLGPYPQEDTDITSSPHLSFSPLLDTTNSNTSAETGKFGQSKVVADTKNNVNQEQQRLDTSIGAPDEVSQNTPLLTAAAIFASTFEELNSLLGLQEKPVSDSLLVNVETLASSNDTNVNDITLIADGTARGPHEFSHMGENERLCLP